MGKVLMKVDSRLFFTVLGIVFLSEMGDKTQVTTMLLAGAKPMHVVWVALGSALALLCTSWIEVLIGSRIIAKYLKPETVRLLSALAFLVLGSLLVSGLLGNIQVS